MKKKEEKEIFRDSFDKDMNDSSNSYNSLLDINFKRIIENLSNTFSIEFKENSIYKDDEFGDMKNAMTNLMDMLCLNSDVFEPNDFIDTVDNYIGNYERILYSTITSYIFSLDKSGDTEKKDNLTNNLEITIDIIEKDKSDSIANRKMYYKFWDHVHLANAQLAQLDTAKNTVIEEISTILNNASDSVDLLKNNVKSLNDNVKKSEENIEKVKDGIYSQLIGIVSIFVGISFVMFGGMSLLNNLFDYSGMKEIPLIEMICGGCVIGIVTIALLYLFIIFILKILDKCNEDTVESYKKTALIIGSALVILLLTFGAYWVWNNYLDVTTQLSNQKCQIESIDKDSNEVHLVCPVDEEYN